MAKRLKICGVTDASFAVAAAAVADCLGFVFAAKSPRRISADDARRIRSAVRARRAAKPLFVGVFAGQGVAEMLDVAAAVPLDVIQLHSPEYSEADVAALRATGREVWRLDAPGAENGAADAVLIDGSAGGVFGGTGRLADWSRIAALKRSGRRVVLAGGIGAGNIAAALATDADVIDVNSSLETAPGVKSIALLDDLVRRISACQAVNSRGSPPRKAQ